MTFTNTPTYNATTGDFTLTPTPTHTPLGQGCQDPVTKKLDYAQDAAPSATPSPGVVANNDASLNTLMKQYSSPTPSIWLNIKAYFAGPATLGGPTIDGASPLSASVTAQLQASTANAASVTLGDFFKPNFAASAQFVYDVTVVTGAGIFTVSIDNKDPVSGKYINIGTSANVSAVTTNQYKVGVGLTAVANLTFNDILAPIYRVRLTKISGTSLTGSVGVNYSQ